MNGDPDFVLGMVKILLECGGRCRTTHHRLAHNGNKILLGQGVQKLLGLQPVRRQRQGVCRQ